MELVSFFYLFFCLSNAIFSLSAHPSVRNGQNWAVLVAGSSGYNNYRHQANLCHAYHNLVAHGIPPSNIITMMYDDVANDTSNPHPGTLINQPNGPDVYHGVIKDYTGDDVTPLNFINVLLGDPGLKVRGKKVLESGPNDNVFIYFTDHGASQIVAFPSDVLHSSDLISTLKQMHEKRMYNKMLFYLEACESGSMWDGLLPEDISIHAISSTTPDQDGYACFCSVPGYDVCIGDEFSDNWMIDSDVGKDFGGETVRQQFLKVKNETIDSTPQMYGDLSIGDMLLAAFQGSVDPPPKPNPIQKCDSPNPSREVPLYAMKQRVAKASPEKKAELQKKLDQMIEAREFLHQSVRNVVRYLCSQEHCKFYEEMIDQRKGSITQHECVEKLIRTFDSHCFKVAKHPYSTKYLSSLVNIAEGLSTENVNGKCSQVAIDLEKACKEMIPKHNFEKIE